MNPGQLTSQAMLFHSTLLPTKKGDQEEVLYIFEQKAQEAWGWENEVILQQPEDIKYLQSVRQRVLRTSWLSW